MMLIDELTARGLKPLNFCDIRTGQMRGSPARLKRVLEWMTARPSLRVVLVNVFAGITDLAEFGDLLATAIDNTPGLSVPVVARLVGRGADEAKRILAERQPDMFVTEDLEAALAGVAGVVGRGPLPPPREGRGVVPLTTPARPPPGRGRRSGASRPCPPPRPSSCRASPAAWVARMRRLMRAYGTNIVGGTATRTDTAEAAGVPVFASCRDAVPATGAVASVAMAPPLETLAAVEEALAAGIRLIVTVAEGIPLHDALDIGRAVRTMPAPSGLAARRREWRSRARSSLASCPMSACARARSRSCRRAARCPTNVGYRLAQAGLGQSIWVGVGGDPVKGVRFADLLPMFFDDPRTHAIVLVGEVGGSEEEECADALLRLGVRKPVYALIAGREAKEGVSMGHAGALVLGEAGTLASKTQRLTEAGARVFGSIEAIIEACVSRISRPMRT